ncbi:MAG: class II aldolase/adducin family protein [bacterium]|nr:class II aldolase/adducin family protein [bacterium]
MNGYKEFSQYCKLLYQKGLAPGCSGNASINKGSHIAITPSGVSMNDICEDNIVEMDFDGNVIGKGKASSEKIMHSLIYKNRPDIKAIIHTHSPFLSTLALKRIGLKDSPIVELKYLFGNEVPLVKYNPPGSNELALGVSEALKTTNAAIMQNHGAIVIAKNIQDAFYTYEVLEYTAQVFVQEKMISSLVF